jgi:hypothetical protein
MCELVAHPGRQVKEKCELFTFFGARFAPLWRRSFWFWENSGKSYNFSIFSFPLHRPTIAARKIPVKPHRLDAARIIRFRAVHQVADRINLQRLLQRMPQRQLVG